MIKYRLIIVFTSLPLAVLLWHGATASPAVAAPPASYPGSNVGRPMSNGSPVVQTNLTSPAVGPGAVGYNMPPTVPPPQTFEAAQIIARVGGEIILAGEVTGSVDALMEENKDRIPAQQWDVQRQLLIQKSLARALESKLVLVDAKRMIPAEGLPDIQEQVNKQFEKEYIKHLMEAAEVNSRAELVAKLAKAGSSIERQRQIYFERSLISQWLRQQTKSTRPILHEDMYAYYQEHLADYEHPAKVRWEQFTVKFDRYESRTAAYQKIAHMGNEVMVRGMDFAKVAAEQSDGSTAREGGARDWTTKGALRSRILDEALFSLPVGQMSRILEDTNAFHIIRVVEFVPAHRTPFRDAQVEIREAIKKQHRRDAEKDYYDRLRKEVRVWTVFDDPAASKDFFSSKQP